MSGLIQLERYDHFLLLTIDRPEVHNAISMALLDALRHFIKDISREENIRALIITGSGEKSFCAGADLKERIGMSEPETLAFVKTIQDTFQSIAMLPFPTIAAINGNAFGGGLELALACDLRIASEKATMGLTECALGIIPGAGGTQRLPILIGWAKAMELIFLAKRIDAREALGIGLINEIAPDGETAKATATAWAKKIANNAPLAIRAAKEAMTAGLFRNLKTGLVDEAACYHQILHTSDRLEGLKAFQEKRPPRFVGK